MSGVAASYAAEAIREIKRSRERFDEQVERLAKRIEAVEKDLVSLRTELRESVDLIIAAIKARP